jgi:hypothetical protein
LAFWNRTTAAAPARRAAFTASSVRIEPGKQPPDIDAAASQRLLLQGWQWESFRYYNTIGEVNFCAQFYARALQNLRLYVGVKDDNGEIEEVDDNPAAYEILDDVQDPGGGRAGMLSAYGQLRWLIGEGYMLVTPSDDPSEPRNQWEFVSPSELRVWEGPGLIRQESPGLPQRQIYYVEDPNEWDPADPKQGIVYRYWRRHPQFSAQADAPMRGCLLICDELERLTAAVRARAVSRIAGAGILLVPDEISPPPPEALGDEAPLEDIFLRELVAGALNPIQDPGTASAVFPVLVRGAAEYLKEMRLLQIHDPNQTYPEEGLRSEAIRRLALSLDMPPEILLGTSDVNHWNAWQIDEQTWKAHLQPVARAFCEDLTSSYFRPAARDAGVANWQQLVVWYDAAEVVNHPDKSKDAKDLYDRRAIGKEALREANGFDDDDAPGPDELNEMIGVEIHDGSLALYGIPSVRANIEPEPGEIEGAQGTVQGPTGPLQGADVEKTPPEPAAPPEDNALTSAARIDLAAEFAIERCRELAGSRLIARLRRSEVGRDCPECLEAMRKVPHGMVASALAEIAQHRVITGLPPAAELVQGGAEMFTARLVAWGVDSRRASRLADTVEAHAARTLFSQDPPPPLKLPTR